jgi:hypothetical protein
MGICLREQTAAHRSLPGETAPAARWLPGLVHNAPEYFLLYHPLSILKISHFHEKMFSIHRVFYILGKLFFGTLPFFIFFLFIRSCNPLPYRVK